MSKKFFYLTAIIFCLLLIVQSQSQNRIPKQVQKERKSVKSEINPIDIQFKNCLEEAEKDSSINISNCFQEAEESWQIELNRTYKNLIEKLDFSGRQSLKDSQISWIKFQDITAKFSRDMERNLNNFHMYPDFAASDKIERIKQRTFELKKYLVLLENK